MYHIIAYLVLSLKKKLYEFLNKNWIAQNATYKRKEGEKSPS